MKNILLLGGNGFIGYECVLKLLSMHTAVKIFVANRGRSFDWDKASVKDHITCVKYNRKDELENYPEFLQLLQSTRFNTVVDFSAYKRSEVKRVLPYVKSDIYIFISSDSVYEVCEKENPNAPTKETDDNRPSDKKARRKLNKADKYGHDKLKCEKYIKQFCSEKGMGYVILRLADVIGPRDGTDRWWQYQMWVTLCTKLSLPIYVPSTVSNSLLSFVYVTDIADVIHTIVTMEDCSVKSLINDTYNLACGETTTITELLQNINYYIYVGDTPQSLDVQVSDHWSVQQIYPSVEKGPIDISKAQRVLNWSPTLLNEVIKSTVQFYEGVLRGRAFSDEKNVIFDSLMSDLKNVSLYTACDVEQFRQLLVKLLK